MRAVCQVSSFWLGVVSTIFFCSKNPTYTWHFLFFSFFFQHNNLRSQINSSETEGGPLFGNLAVCSGRDWTREDQSFQWKADEWLIAEARCWEDINNEVHFGALHADIHKTGDFITPWPWYFWIKHSQLRGELADKCQFSIWMSLFIFFGVNGMVEVEILWGKHRYHVSRFTVLKLKLNMI